MMRLFVGAWQSLGRYPGCDSAVVIPDKRKPYAEDLKQVFSAELSGRRRITSFKRYRNVTVQRSHCAFSHSSIRGTQVSRQRFLMQVTLGALVYLQTSEKLAKGFTQF